MFGTMSRGGVGVCLSRRSMCTAVAPKLTVLPREEQGSRYSRKMRKEGFIPGVVYGQGQDGEKSRVMVRVNKIEFLRELRRIGKSIENTVYELSVEGGATELVTPRQVTFNPREY